MILEQIYTLIGGPCDGQRLAYPLPAGVALTGHKVRTGPGRFAFYRVTGAGVMTFAGWRIDP